jgi:hypothetical protein
MKINRTSFQSMLVAGTCGIALAVTGTAMASDVGLSGSATFGSAGYPGPAFSSPPAGAQSGLTTTVQYYVPTFGSDTGPSGGYVGAGGYSTPQGGMATGGPTLQTLANMEKFLASGSITVPAADSNNGSATTYTTASETHAVTTMGNVVEGSNPDYPGYALNKVPAGAAVAYNVDQQGYIDIATAGKYTFEMAGADDAAEVYIGGNGTIGSGTAIVANAYTNFSGDFPSTATTSTVTFSTPGLYNFELFYYQGYGGQGLNFTVTPPTGIAAPTYYAAVPEPASLGLCTVGALGLLLLRKRRGIA